MYVNYGKKIRYRINNNKIITFLQSDQNSDVGILRQDLQIQKSRSYNFLDIEMDKRFQKHFPRFEVKISIKMIKRQ